MKVAFDCDGTLKNLDNTLRDEVCRLPIAFLMANAKVIVWSGGGKNYAEGVWFRVIHEYKLRDHIPHLLDGVTVMMKDKYLKPDLAIDDEYVVLGQTNIRFPAAHTHCYKCKNPLCSLEGFCE